MTPSLILDSNVVLDWLVFNNPCAAPIEAAIREGKVRWIVTAAMRAELDHVLAYASIARWRPDAAKVADTFERWSLQVEAPSILPATVPQCTDADDQKFIDLAVSVQDVWLLTRDRALLKLARRVRPWKVAVAVPEKFSLSP